MDELLKAALLFGVGLIAGFINVMAGGGSTLTLPALIFLGLDSACANGSNRVALVIQNISAIGSFRQEKVHEFGTSIKLALFTLPGAILGALFAVKIDNILFQKILAVVMIGIIFTLILPKKKTPGNGKAATAWLIYPAMILIGFYGGFIQAGVGFLFMAALQNILKLDLVRVNMHKVFIIFCYTIPALLIFALTDNVNWLFGLLMGGGNALGAWWSAKMAIKKGEKIIRFVLIVAIIIMAAKLLRLF